MPRGYMKKFGCPGNGRKKNPQIHTMNTMISDVPVEITWREGKGKNFKKQAKKQRRRHRKQSKRLAIVLKNEDQIQKNEIQLQKKKLIKQQEKELRALRQRFFRDIYNMWERHANELDTLNSDL